jgi:Domain of Unknown Function with PDB structure (DUF3857)/Transglutaminase-like superfamily
MNNKRFCALSRKPRYRNRTLTVLLLAMGLGGWTPVVRAAVPDWLREAAATQLPKYPDDVKAAVLLDEQVTTVTSGGEIKTRYRTALKILRPEGRELGTVQVYFDNETRLTYLKAWSIPASGQAYEVNEKEAAEAGFPGGGELYSDTRFKILTIPAADPGNVIGYEYERRRRPFILQDIWQFQDDIPVKKTRFELELPQGWEFNTFWLNHPAEKPQSLGGNHWVWEIGDLAAVEDEPFMPDWRAVAGRMAVSYAREPGEATGSSQASWADTGSWFARLAEGRRQVTPEIQQKVAELTATSKTTLDKIDALTRFVQQGIRYVAIEIGIGGYQPHPAAKILADRYGDCKDKATLLSAMLKAIGVDSYYVLVNTRRGVVSPDLPSALTFNHVILAVRLPDEVPRTNLYALREDKALGHLLFFDPTDPLTQLGYLSMPEQRSYGLLVANGTGQLVELPLLPPAVNRLLRVANLRLSPAGDLSGGVKEIRWGAPNAAERSQLLGVPEAGREKKLENFLGNFLGSLVLESAKVQNLEDPNQNLIVTYAFLARDYAKRAGNLLLIRPRVLGEKTMDLSDDKERKRSYAVEFPSTTLETDAFDITLPAGYVVDELPPPVEIKYDFGDYRSKVDITGNTLHYRRSFEIKQVRVPMAQVEKLKEFFTRIEADERSSAVLKQIPEAQPSAPTGAPR